MKQLLAIVTTLILGVLSFSAPAEALSYHVSQKTLSSFSSTNTFLTSRQKVEIRAALATNPNAQKLICTGIRYELDATVVNTMVRARAKAACDYAKQLRPGISTWYQNKVTKASSFAGRVLLTIKTSQANSTNSQSPETKRFLFKSFDTELSLDNLAEYDVPQIAMDEMWGYFKKQPKVTEFSNLELHISPNAPTKYVKDRIADLKNVMSAWKSLAWPAKVVVMFYVPEDAAWAEHECEVVVGAYDCGEQAYFDNTGYAKNSASSLKSGGAWLQVGINGEQFESFQHGGGIAHEYWHVATVSDGGMWESGSPALWWFEGSADFMGDAFKKRPKTQMMYNSKSFDPWHEGYDETRFSRVLHSITPEITQDLFSKLYEHDPKPSRDVVAHYELGNYATEALVAVYGYEKFMEFSSNKNGTFDDQFKSVYGISAHDFYGKLAGYLKVRLDYTD